MQGVVQSSLKLQHDMPGSAEVFPSTLCCKPTNQIESRFADYSPLVHDRATDGLTYDRSDSLQKWLSRRS